MSGKILESQRLRLRPVTERDISRLYDWYADPETMALYDGIQFDTSEPDVFAEEFNMWLETEVEFGQAGAFILERKDTGEAIGECTWILIERNGPESPGIYQVGGMIGPEELRGKGYGTEALHSLREYLFQDLGAHRLEAMTGAFNTGAMRTLHRNGFTRDGVLRESLYVNGVWHDRVIFSILRREWENGSPAERGT